MNKNLLVSLLTILLLSLYSCGPSEADKSKEDRKVLFRAKQTWTSDITFNSYVSSNTEVIKADSAYKDGDTAILYGKTYILLERVK